MNVTEKHDLLEEVRKATQVIRKAVRRVGQSVDYLKLFNEELTMNQRILNEILSLQGYLEDARKTVVESGVILELRFSYKLMPNIEADKLTEEAKANLR
mgnify:CR=1 FL=1